MHLNGYVTFNMLVTKFRDFTKTCDRIACRLLFVFNVHDIRASISDFSVTFRPGSV